MRFRAPPRGQIPAAAFEHPIFSGVGEWRDWLTAADWPDIEAVDAAFASARHAVSGVPLTIRAQTPDLLGDGLHYETRIQQLGKIATRAQSWHDLLNAVCWLAYPHIKAAINARQAADVARVGPRQRTRAQCALTHFDEAGVVILLRDPERLAAWGRHDWPGLFGGLGADEFALAVIGHALLEHALLPEPRVVGKALIALHGQPARGMDAALEAMAQGIQAGRLLTDPQELRPLPLAGLPGWHARAGEPEFLTSEPCFRPLREGREYPPALEIETWRQSSNAAA